MTNLPSRIRITADFGKAGPYLKPARVGGLASDRKTHLKPGKLQALPGLAEVVGVAARHPDLIAVSVLSALPAVAHLEYIRRFQDERRPVTDGLAVAALANVLYAGVAAALHVATFGSFPLSPLTAPLLAMNGLGVLMQMKQGQLCPASFLTGWMDASGVIAEKVGSIFGEKD